MLVCEGCRADSPADAAFCARCGYRLGPGRQVSTAAALRRAERKVVTVLFADIKGSLALLAGQDPELGGEIMASVVAIMAHAVRTQGGFVNQVMGDGIMALFGAPLAAEDHAVQACLAALSMRAAIAHQVRPAVHVRVGLGSGEVVVRAMPGDSGLHYSGAGEAVHLAARMEQAAGPDQILLTEATCLFAAGSIEARAVPDVMLKDAAGTPVFELVRMRSGQGTAPARPRRHTVGRDRELSLLRRARDLAAGGDGQSMRLVGDPGSGKSHLVREFTEGDLPDGWRLCQAGAVSHRRTSYGVVGDLLTRLFRLEPADPAEVRREKVMAALDLVGAAASPTLAPLSPLLGLQAETPAWTALDAWERREASIAAVVGAFQRSSERAPLALVVEDSHWLDAESASSIQRLGATAAGRQMLSVVTERTGQVTDAAAWRQARWQECPVGPLDESGTTAFLRGRLLPGPDVAALERKLIEHTRGNPLFLEECLQALVDSGDLVPAGELFRLVNPVPGLRVPDSLRACWMPAWTGWGRPRRTCCRPPRWWAAPCRRTCCGGRRGWTMRRWRPRWGGWWRAGSWCRRRRGTRSATG